MVEEVRFPLKLTDGMVGGPPNNRGQNDSLVGKWTIGIITCGITQQMGIAGGIGEIIFALVLMHPGSFKEPPLMITCSYGLPFLIEYHHIPELFCKPKHIITQLGHPGT